MGHEALSERHQYIIETSRTKELREELKGEFMTLLQEGGVITRRGTILALPITDVISEMPRPIQDQLEISRVAKVNLNQIKSILNREIDVSHSRSVKGYVFAPNAIERLSYRTWKGGSILPCMIGFNGGIVMPQTDEQHFLAAFKNRTEMVIKHEGILGSHFRFTTSILKELSDEYGLGHEQSEKARKAIYEGKETLST